MNLHLAETANDIAGLGTPAGIVTAIATLIIALTGLLGGITILLPRIKELIVAIHAMKDDVNTVHDLVESHVAESKETKTELIESVTSAAAEVLRNGAGGDTAP